MHPPLCGRDIGGCGPCCLGGNRPGYYRQGPYFECGHPMGARLGGDPAGEQPVLAAGIVFPRRSRFYRQGTVFRVRTQNELAGWAPGWPEADSIGRDGGTPVAKSNTGWPAATAADPGKNNLGVQLWSTRGCRALARARRRPAADHHLFRKRFFTPWTITTPELVD